MLRKFALSFGLALLVGSWCARAQGPPTDETIKVETRLVSIPTIVSDRNGRYVPNLMQRDFSVFQDGVPQQIEFFASTEEPINVALLIDTSHSTRPVLGDIKDSAKAFIKLLKPQDKAMVVAFDYDTHVLSGLTSDHEQLRKVIKDIEIPEYFGTTLRDAVWRTINGAFRGLNGRKAIIVLTDGKDAGSRIRQNDLLYRLQETDTLIYTVMFKTGERQPNFFPRMSDRDIWIGRFPRPRFPDRRQRQRQERAKVQNAVAEEFLNELSDVTAGRHYSSENGKLKKTFEMIVEELRYQYRLGFYPPEANDKMALHTLKVKVARPEAVVRARGSYRIQAR